MIEFHAVHKTYRTRGREVAALQPVDLRIEAGEIFGLIGHSDADALTHAVIDAVLGAAGLGDIGQHFPDTDEEWHDADSLDLLRRVSASVDGHGFVVTHVDATVICEAPKLGPYRDPMRAAIAGALGLAAEAVNVKFTTNERMGSIGRGEGIAAMAVATLERAS